MFVPTCRIGCAGLLCAALLAGCTTPAQRAPADQESSVRAAFAELQAVIKARDAHKLWMLLDNRSRADATRAAKAIQTAYAQASDDEKAKQAEALGLTGPDLAGLTGAAFLRTMRFQNKYQELPASAIEKVTIEADSATIHYREPDGDKEKLILVRQEGEWKVWLTMPRGPQP